MFVRTSLVITLLCCSALSCVAQTRFQVWADAGAFRYDEEKSYVELWYAFPRSALAYRNEQGAYRASVMMTAIVSREQAGSEPLSRIWRVPVQTGDTSASDARLLIGKIQFTLAPGRYAVTVYGRQEDLPSRGDTIKFPLEVRPFSARGVRFSDIELCSSVQRASGDTTNMFYKNTLEVVPNPPLIFGGSLPAVMYYAELYNPDLDVYSIRSEIVSSYGNTVAAKVQRKTGRHPSRVETGGHAAGTLPTGVYTLILSYGDTTGAMRVSQSKRFYVYNPSVAADSSVIRRAVASIAYEFASLAEDELDAQFSSAIYIATSDEKKLWSSLSGAEPKRKFLTQFWNTRDPDTMTPVNEAYIDYQARVQYTNQHYRTSYRQGWKTDRGRVYIMYGPPDYVQRNQVESDTKPYEVWTYDSIQSGVEFVFVDKGGFNELELVHSTMRDEISNPSWQSHIRTR
ncbi:MAG: GWxTD domain-containing protein [Ignavibacteriae bacterium]|nr:GWxTD domain-containing protein [Ignavibacteriota bacterium]